MKSKLANLTFKKLIRQLPYVLLLSAILICLIAVAGFCANKVLYPSDTFVKTSVAIVTPEPDDPYLGFAMNMLDTMKSTSDKIKFFICDEEEGKKLLEEETVVALIIFPDNAINSIMTGENLPITIMFKSDDALASTILAEFSYAGTKLLAGAQAGTYTTYDYYVKYNKTDSLSDTYNKVDIINYSYALSRIDTFKEVLVSFGGTTNTVIYYLSSGLLLFLLLLGAAYLAVFSSENSSFLAKLRTQHVSQGQYFTIQLICYFIFQFVLLSASFLVLGILGKYISRNYADFLGSIPLQPEFSAATLLFIGLLTLFLVAYLFLILALTGGNNISVLLLFLISSLLLLFSGGIIPIAFFPNVIRKISGFLPTSSLRILLAKFLQGELSSMKDYAVFRTSMIQILIWSIIFILLAHIITYCRKEDHS